MTGHVHRFRSLLSWRNLRWALAAALVPVGLWACGSHPLEQPKPLPEAQTDLLYDVNPLRQLDLIFMVDNSSSMREEQANLKANFPSFMTELQKIQGGLPDMHIAVISSNFGAGEGMPSPECPRYGDAGRYLAKAGCGFDATGGEHFLRVDATGPKNFPANLQLPDVFGCLAELGTNGCGYEHQLQSLRASLAPNVNQEVTSFLRKDAYLGIVLLSDEDDCSGDPKSTLYDGLTAGQAGSLRCSLKGHVCNGQPVPAMNDFSAPLSSCAPYVANLPAEQFDHLINVSEFVEFIKGVKNYRTDKILVSSVIGWDDSPGATYGITQRQGVNGIELDTKPICSTATTGSAAPGIRLNAFTKAFENNSVHSICQADLSVAMKEIGAKLAKLIENTCITAPLFDTDLGVAGVQADCQVVDRIPDDRSPTGYRDQPIGICAPGVLPCWDLLSDNACNSGFRTVVNREGGAMAAPGTLQSIKCRTCTENDLNDPTIAPRCMR